MTAIVEGGRKVKAIENRPTLLPGMNFYIEAYNQLFFDKSVGMSVGSIPWSSIIKWCSLNDINDINDIDTCVRYIRKIEETDNKMAEQKKA